MSELECQTEYSLVPVDTVCPVNENPDWSAVYVNEIQHIWWPTINITIPEEYAWDYNYWNDSGLNIVISGFNVDYEYMDNVINTQKTLPNDIDFNNIVSSIVPLFVPWIVIIFFLYFVFKFIKKIF